MIIMKVVSIQAIIKRQNVNMKEVIITNIRMNTLTIKSKKHIQVYKLMMLIHYVKINIFRNSMNSF